MINHTQATLFQRVALRGLRPTPAYSTKAASSDRQIAASALFTMARGGVHPPGTALFCRLAVGVVWASARWTLR